jgi:hypothetical protein
MQNIKKFAAKIDALDGKTDGKAFGQAIPGGVSPICCPFPFFCKIWWTAQLFYFRGFIVEDWDRNRHTDW